MWHSRRKKLSSLSLFFSQCQVQEREGISGYSVTHSITHQVFTIHLRLVAFKIQELEHGRFIKCTCNQFEYNLTKEFNYACKEV